MAAVINHQAGGLAREHIQEIGRILVDMDRIDLPKHDFGDGGLERRMVFHYSAQEVGFRHDPHQPLIIDDRQLTDTM